MKWGLDRVSVRFGSRPALTDVTVPAEPGSVTVVVGGDGAGKSTSLRCLVGLVLPSEGRVSRPAKAGIGYVPATAGLYVDLTVDENMAFTSAAYGVRDADYDGMLRRLGLASARHRLGGQLSGGMQRKLAVGLALIHTPDLLVLDEPTTGVDPLSRMDLWRLISSAAAAGAAVVVSTTYVNEAERGTCAILLNEGRVLASGPARDIAAGVPGTVGRRRGDGTAPPPGESWRRGADWRVWAPSGDLPDGVQAVQPDLQDAAIIAELAAERGISSLFGKPASAPAGK